jgi:CheY-like chemotaxis protein/phage FluMu protein Com
MKLRVRCADCGAGFLLDQVFAGSSLPCPQCGTAEGLRVPSSAEATTADPAEPSRAETVPLSAAPAPDSPGPAAAPDAEGTTATVVKPVARKPDAEEVVCPRCKLHFVPRRGVAQSDAEDRRTVLVVEPNDYFRETVQEALRTKFEVKTAAELAEAREHLAVGRIDLIVLDPALGGGEQGIDLLRELPRKPCPILVFTDKDEAEMYGEGWEELQRLGADDMVMKGMQAGESLLRKVSVVLGERLDEDD